MHSVQLGATVASTIEQGVTHVVAGSSGTEKAIQGRRQGLLVVSVDWLVASGRRLATIFSHHNHDCLPSPPFVHRSALATIEQSISSMCSIWVIKFE